MSGLETVNQSATFVFGNPLSIISNPIILYPFSQNGIAIEPVPTLGSIIIFGKFIFNFSNSRNNLSTAILGVA